MAISDDNERLVTGSGDKTIRVWDLATAREIRRLPGHTDVVHAIALTGEGYGWSAAVPTGPPVSGSSPSAEKSAPSRDRPTAGGCERLSADRHQVSPRANADNTARSFWNQQLPASRRASLKGTQLASPRWPCRPRAIGRATGSEDNTARLWESRHRQGPADSTRSPSSGFWPATLSGRRQIGIGTGSSDNIARLWDVNNVKEIRGYLGHWQFRSPPSAYPATANGWPPGSYDHHIRHVPGGASQDHLAQSLPGHTDCCSAMLQP